MSAAAQLRALLLLLLSGVALVCGDPESSAACPAPCACVGTLLDCGRRLAKGAAPPRLPAWVTQLDLSHNKLRALPGGLLAGLQHLSEIKLNNNEFETIPDFGSCSGNISALIL
ncbi:hypothetical protein SRHO_G00088490 [Serrasalmus rhombeus]